VANSPSSEQDSANDPSESTIPPTRTRWAPRTDDRFDVPLRGVDVGPETRCAHYRGPQDVIAVRFPCCNAFYPCHACHEALTDHAAERWAPDQFDTPGVLCGQCRAVLSIEQYLNANSTCPSCGTAFNPGCARHHNRYFEVR